MGLRSRLSEILARRMLAGRHMNRAIRGQFMQAGIKFYRECGDHGIIFYPDAVGALIMRDGEFTRKSVRDLRQILAAQGLFRPGSTVLELGANIGTHSIYFCLDLEAGQVVAVEPDPETHDVLRRNIALNELQTRIRPVRAAISDRDGTATFTRDPGNRGASALAETGRRNLRGDSFEVELLTPAGLLARCGLSLADIGLVWIDVEAHEAAVLRAMAPLLESHRPPIFFEYAPAAADGPTRTALADLIYGHYASVHLHDEETGFAALDRASFLALETTRDILLMPG